MKKPPTKGAIAFSAEFLDEDGLRNARMALADPKTPAALRAELERYLENPLKAATSDMQQLLDERMRYRSGRPSGKDRDTTERVRQHVRDLRMLHPTASAKKLQEYAKGDPAMADDVKDIQPGRWANLVSEVAPPHSRKARRAR